MTSNLEVVFQTERGIRAGHDAIHSIFVALRLHALESIKAGTSYDARFVCQLSDWVEVLPEYMNRSDGTAVEDFRMGLQALAELHPMFRGVRRRFDQMMEFTHPLPTVEQMESAVAEMRKGE